MNNNDKTSELNIKCIVSWQFLAIVNGLKGLIGGKNDNEKTTRPSKEVKEDDERIQRVRIRWERRIIEENKLY